MSKRPIGMLLMAVLAVLLLPAAAQAITYNGAVNKLVKDGYPQKIVKQITSMGTSPTLGFRWAGSPSDNASARYIAAEMRLIGLKGVALEKVPLDVWDYRSASVAVNGKKYVASGFAGARGTNGVPLTAEIVYVGSGTIAEFLVAGDVSGKIVLVDFDGYDWWSNFPQMLAGYLGASAVVMTHAPDDLPITGEFFSGDNALGSFDAETDYDAPPLVYISRAAGATVRAACAAGTTTASVTADIRSRLEEDGGFGYNVVGKINGSTNRSQMVVVSAHHDAHFRGAEDDTSAIATALTMAKAMKMSDTTPKKTLQFLFTTGEEFGTTNSWYDWLIGSYHAITVAHPEWVGRVAGQINLEWQGAKGAPMQVRCNPEMATWVQEVLDSSATLLPHGVDNGGLVRRNVWTWNDQWPFTAAGVPSVYFVTKDATYRGQWYHSQYDTAKLIDWAYLGMNAKLYRRVHAKLDAGVLPYDFSARVDQFTDNFDPAALVSEGVDAALVDTVAEKLNRLSDAAARFASGKDGIGAGQHGIVNARLMRAEAVLNSSLTALDQWDGTTYPHVQLLSDLGELNATLALVAQPSYDPAAAQAALYDVGPFYYGDYFGQRVYERQLVRQRPTYYRINWAGLGHLEVYPDIYDEYQLLGTADYLDAVEPLEADRDALLAQLETALGEEARALNNAAAIIEEVTPWSAGR